MTNKRVLLLVWVLAIAAGAVALWAVGGLDSIVTKLRTGQKEVEIRALSARLWEECEYFGEGSRGALVPTDAGRVILMQLVARGKSVVPQLLNCVREGERGEKVAAALALSNITGRGFGKPSVRSDLVDDSIGWESNVVKPYREWYEKNEGRSRMDWVIAAIEEQDDIENVVYGLAALRNVLIISNAEQRREEVVGVLRELLPNADASCVGGEYWRLAWNEAGRRRIADEFRKTVKNLSIEGL